MKNIRILSTKALTPPQRERLLHAGFALVETPLIQTMEVAFPTPLSVEKAIITSQNAVKAIAGKSVNIERCYCVGEKTEAALKRAGFTVELCAGSAVELANELIDRHRGETFYYLGTKARRKELPEILKKHQTPLKEVEVYETHKRPVEIPGTFDGILFFSPSAVETFHELNSAEGATCFCIGPTTAQALDKSKARVVTAAKPTAEHLILEAIKYFNKERQHSTIQ